MLVVWVAVLALMNSAPAAAQQAAAAQVLGPTGRTVLPVPEPFHERWGRTLFEPAVNTQVLQCGHA